MVNTSAMPAGIRRVLVLLYFQRDYNMILDSVYALGRGYLRCLPVPTLGTFWLFLRTTVGPEYTPRLGFL